MVKTTIYRLLPTNPSSLPKIPGKGLPSPPLFSISIRVFIKVENCRVRIPVFLSLLFCILLVYIINGAASGLARDKRKTNRQASHREAFLLGSVDPR
jgi:hypothetical protein